MSERTAVQQPLLNYATDIGWECINRNSAANMRGNDSAIYFVTVLDSQLRHLNPRTLDENRATDIIRRLKLLNPTIEGNRKALSWIRGEHSVFVPKEKRERNVHVIDFDNLDSNVFQVTDEWRQKGTIATNRADVIFLINGIPIAIAETKSASKRDGLAEGIEQIRRYHEETPEMFISTQVFGVTHLIDFYYGGTWSTNRKNIFNWKEEESGNYERKVKAFFDRERILKTLQDYIIFITKDDELIKILLRQHQTRAVEKVLNRVNDPIKKRGLIWHTQGSGKTLTMITIAAKLLEGALGDEKPTVLMLIDRNELETQLFRNITWCDIPNPQLANSKKELRDVLASDYRGLIVSMIHKFDGIPASINTRKNVVVLVDEAHRTTSGDLGNYLMAALPNASYIGFTGTPIDRLSKGKGTFKVFGGDDPTGYLDKYSIAESIEDGTTVKLNYALAPSDLRINYDTLQAEFLGLVEAEGVSDIDTLNLILNRAVKLKEVMKAPDRMDRIAQYVADHFKNTVEPMGFKAFLVAVDREACALYKEALDKYLPSRYSQVVYSSAQNDRALLKQYHLSEGEEKTIRKEFTKKAEFPKILIVTEKLLTGFDAPILYCMYLDKPMRDHVLLQAIARVNRPYEEDGGVLKPCGFIIDFVGIFEKLEKALAFDSDVVASVIQNVDELQKLFAQMMHQATIRHLPWASGFDDKAKERAIDHFENKERREEFFAFFKQVQTLYDILSPDAFLSPFIQDYGRLSELYGLIRNTTVGPPIDKELTAKTKKLLRGATGLESLEVPGAIYELDSEALLKLKESNLSSTTKVINLRKALIKLVIEKGHSEPYLQPIGERVRALEEQYDDRIKTTEETLREFEKLAEECIDAEYQREKLGLNPNAFAIYTILEPITKKGSVDQAVSINMLFDQFTDYTWDEKQASALRAELYKALLPVLGKKEMFKVTNILMALQRA
jgi:type I restriction enzyme R subunit